MNVSEATSFVLSQSEQTSYQPGAWRQFAICEQPGDLLIGDIGLWFSHDGLQAEFGISITPAAQGKGYGTECVRGLLELLFSRTSVREVVASADIRNHACLAMLAHAGMHHIDTRQAEYKGELCTEHMFSARRADDSWKPRPANNTE